MANHPNRSKGLHAAAVAHADRLTAVRFHPGRNPKPAEIVAAREAAGLTQTEAAALVFTTCRVWQQWEAGDRRMHPAFWQLFTFKSSSGPPAR